jgi:hypothetical protein
MNSELEKLLPQIAEAGRRKPLTAATRLLRNANLSWQASAESAGLNAVKNASLHTASFLLVNPSQTLRVMLQL